MARKWKFYCYVDETGQDTFGRLFIVAVVITDEQRDELRQVLQRIEKTSNKRIRKWTDTPKKERKAYIKAVIAYSGFKNLMSYSVYEDTKTYVDLTILSVAKAIHAKQKASYEAIVYVDGMKRSEQHRFAAGLRKLDVKVHKVRGLRDQSDEFIRLADAIAGFTRDALGSNAELKTLLKRAVKIGIISQV